MRPYLRSWCSCALLLSLTHCTEGSAGDCGTDGGQESACAQDSACAWTGEEQGACLPRCADFEDCTEGEACIPRPLRSASGDLEPVDVCVSRGLIDPPETPAEREVAQAECRARPAETCHRNPRCIQEPAFKLDLDAQCQELVFVGCFASGTSCTLSTFVAEDAAGDLFIFAAGCQNQDFTPVAFDFDDPLFQLLFEEETIVYNWPFCG